MKLLLLFACIAVASAGYCNYGYDYFYRYNFYVYPDSSYYCYSVYFRDDWCSYAYYESILKYYPNDHCMEDGWYEASVEDLRVECINILAEVLYGFTYEMMEHRDEWIYYIEEVHYDYKYAFEDYVYQYYDYRISCTTDYDLIYALEYERDALIAEYCTKLNNLKQDAIDSYNDAIYDTIYTIQEFHDSLVANAVKCLETRLEKIYEYEYQLQDMVYSLLDQYWEYLTSVVKCRADSYRQALECVHGTEWMVDKIDELMYEFYEQECYPAKDLLYTYSYDLYAYKDQLLRFYRCSYRCYVSNGGLRFFSRYYYNLCANIGGWCAWPKMTIRKIGGIGPFQYNFRKTTYTGLTQCDWYDMHKSADEYRTEFEDLLYSHVYEIEYAFYEWKDLWTNYHLEYCDRYDAIIRERHQWCLDDLRAYYVCYYNSYVLPVYIEDEIAAKAAELEELRIEALDAYKTSLYDSLYACYLDYYDQMDQYMTCANELIDEIITKYQDCLDRRYTAIYDYEYALYQQHYEAKDKLVEHMWEAKNCHYDAYLDIHRFYIGEELNDCANYIATEYAYELIYMCEGIEYEYEYCSYENIYALVEHYACNYKCSISALCFPTWTWGSYYSWRVCYPTASCYTYSYQRYTTYCYYQVYYVNNAYVYCL